MNYGSMLNGWLQDALDWVGDFFGSLFDAIVKIIYFIFAAFCSGIDALQALIRKLAGLDTYYQMATGEAVSNTDPLTEFIYGILGIGENSAVYKGLSTVFWSLAIFGIIVLVVSTMVAIIKSHYNEDSAGTSPSKFIYTAIKSVLTFAVVPLAVVIGMQLSSFVLRTVDKITAGTTTEGAIKGVYGEQATEIFQGSTMEGFDAKTYSNYDLFGQGSPTNTATFGGMLFRATMYGANRARSGNVPYGNFQKIESNGKQIFGDASKCPEFSALQSNEDKREYVAYQIDYAFINCLKLQSGISYKETVEMIDVRWTAITDFFKSGNTIDDFSKFDVSDVWIFYNMWATNWIVGFGAGVSIFGIMLSIIVGLMSRLVKGAALFLVYPPLLGIAPLDNFKAFKGWVSNFMQQVMMAFGAIIGMNILLLLVPFMQQIAFFNIPLIDSIVQAVVIIAGLMMAKDFIGMVGGFVGGADAVGAGDGLKGGIAGGFKTGLGIAGKGMATTAKVGMRVGKATGHLVGGTVKAVGGKIKSAKIAKNIEKAKHDPNSKQYKERQASSQAFKQYKEDLAKNNRDIAALEGSVDLRKAGKALNKAGNDAYNKVIARGGSVEEAEQARRDVKLKGMLKDKGKLEEYEQLLASRESNKEELQKHGQVLDKYNVDELVKDPRYKLAKGANGGVVSQFTFKGAFAENFLGKKKYDEEGNYKGLQGGVWGDMKDTGKTMADGFLKVIKDGIGKGTGIDKMLGGAGDIFKDMRFTKGVQGKFLGSGKEKLEGDKLQQEIDKKRETAEKAQLAATQSQTSSIESLAGILKDVATATKATTAAVNKLGKTFTNSNGGSGGSGGTSENSGGSGGSGNNS